MLSKISDTVQIVIAAAFEAFAVWNFQAPVDEALVTQLVALIFALIGAIIGAPAASRKLQSKGYFPALDSDGKKL